MSQANRHITMAGVLGKLRGECLEPVEITLGEWFEGYQLSEMEQLLKQPTDEDLRAAIAIALGSE